jgi:hypothetical protein
MTTLSASTVFLTALALLLAFAVAGFTVGFLQTLIVMALAASAAMLTGLVAVSLSRKGY